MRKLIFLFLAGCAAHHPATLPFAGDIPRKAGAEAEGKNVMISTDGEAASRAGRRMIELGGNAVDAAVASSFAISVERPHSTGLGGGGFLLLYLAEKKQTLAFDFRERAPRLASRDMFLDGKGDPVPNASLDGGLASATPGLVAGLVEVQKKYGKLTLAEVLQPAIELAEGGFVVYGSLAKALKERSGVLARFPASKKIFLHEDGSPLEAGENLKQVDLAKTLRSVAARGRDGFYAGWVANAIVKSNEEAGGLIRLADLRGYRVKMRPPVRGTFREYEIVSMPPPSSGGAHVVEILNILERDPLAALGAASAQSIHLQASAMQRAFADRAEYLGDPDFVKVPLAGLTAKTYAAKLRAQIPERNASPSLTVKPGRPPGVEPEHTTHLTVMDGAGNTVTSTQTINGYFGSGLVAAGTGVLLNNEMDDFSVKPGVANLFGAIGNDKNAVAAEKRPLSSMSPTIVFRGGEPFLALGSPSGTRIITCVAQTLLNRLAYGMPLYEAVAVIRYHHQWLPDEIRVDSPGFAPFVTRELETRGYRVRVSDLGCRVAAVERSPAGLRGVADPRGEGIALGN